MNRAKPVIQIIFVLIIMILFSNSLLMGLANISSVFRE